MTEKELKKLNRKQLLELLLMQTDRADQLERKLAQLEKRLSDRNIAEMEAGSIAEAALKLNGVFEAAEAAAAQYLENIRRLSQHLEESQDPVEWEQLPEEGTDGDGET